MSHLIRVLPCPSKSTCIFIQQASARDAIAVTPELWRGDEKKKKEKQNTKENQVCRLEKEANLCAVKSEKQ